MWSVFNGFVGHPSDRQFAFFYAVRFARAESESVRSGEDEGLDDTSPPGRMRKLRGHRRRNTRCARYSSITWRYWKRRAKQRIQVEWEGMALEASSNDVIAGKAGPEGALSH